ncbi:unnamed protein product [Heterobilharzia americana]|nr:unnamed protein product [Heterobilharzia americana]
MELSKNKHIHCTLIRDSNGLGFSIAGGRGSLPPLLDNEAIYVSKITEGGAAQRQGRIKTGDQIISINGVDIRNARHDEAISLLTSSQSVNLDPVKTSTNGYITSPAVVVKRSDDFQNATESIDPNTDGCIFGKSDSRVYLYSEKGLAICIFISKISADGAAANTGLRIGDRILRVNGVDLRHATHDEAVQELIKPVKELQLECITVTKRPGERYGLRVTGGLSTGDCSPVASLGSCMSSLANDDGIFVTWVSPDGVIARDGRLKPGDRLLEINGHWLMESPLMKYCICLEKHNQH